LLAQEKVTKEKGTPELRARLRRVRGQARDSHTRHPAAGANGAHPCAPPLRGLVRTCPPLRYGAPGKTNVKTKSLG